MSDDDTKNLRGGQVTGSAAEIYEEFFLPALFAEWPPRILDSVELQSGERVLDVACGTGVLARAAKKRVGLSGSVVGLDLNEGMLAVAHQKAPAVDWRQGTAEALPFDDNSFDVVVSQFGLMFFENQKAAIAEMVRVLRPGGRLGVAVWDLLDHTPGYAAITQLLARLFGDDVAVSLTAPYTLGDTSTLRMLFSDAGVADVDITTHDGTARFSSIQAWMHTDVKGWTLSDVLDDTQYELLLREAEKELQHLVVDDGTVSFPAPAHIVLGTK